MEKLQTPFVILKQKVITRWMKVICTEEMLHNYRHVTIRSGGFTATTVQADKALRNTSHRYRLQIRALLKEFNNFGMLVKIQGISLINRRH